jgi:hypothetical protein
LFSGGLTEITPFPPVIVPVNPQRGVWVENSYVRNMTKVEKANCFIIPPIVLDKEFISHWLLQSVALEHAEPDHEVVDFVLCKRSKLSNFHETLDYI